MDIKDQLKDIPIGQVSESLGLGLTKHGTTPPRRLLQAGQKFYRVLGRKAETVEEQVAMKKSPFCAEEIQDNAIKCKHCGEWLEKDIQEPPQLNKINVAKTPDLQTKDTAKVENGEASILPWGTRMFIRIAIYIVSFLITVPVILVILIGIFNLKSGYIHNYLPVGFYLFVIVPSVKKYLDKKFPLYKEPSSLPLKECPKCKQKVVYQAYIEDGGQGDWCPNCKESVKKMRGEI